MQNQRMPLELPATDFSDAENFRFRYCLIGAQVFDR